MDPLFHPSRRRLTNCEHLGYHFIYIPLLLKIKMILNNRGNLNKIFLKVKVFIVTFLTVGQAHKENILKEFSNYSLYFEEIKVIPHKPLH